MKDEIKNGERYKDLITDEEIERKSFNIAFESGMDDKEFIIETRFRNKENW
jgi:hypothetical protein